LVSKPFCWCSSGHNDTTSENVSDDASGANALCNLSFDSALSGDTVAGKTMFVSVDFMDISKY
jgi:hypothetical protein